MRLFPQGDSREDNMKTKDAQIQTKQIPASWDHYCPMIQQRLHRQFGLVLQDHERSNLWQAVEQRIEFHQLDSLSQYFDMLNRHHNQEWKDLLNLITIKHTFFFRNQPQFAALEKVVLPELTQHKKKQSPYKKPSLTIWSAGCSTGEEPYSIAMLLNHCLNLADWHVEILATDLSEQALNLARMGIYSPNAVQSLERTYSERFFKTIAEAEATGYVIDENVKKMVRFDYLNLMDPQFPQQVDIIFCRNVMIYFDPTSIQGLIKRFEQSLTNPGYLFIGHSESLHGLPHDLHLRHEHEGIFYQKTPPPTALGRQLVQKRIHTRPKRHLIAIPTQNNESLSPPPLTEQLEGIDNAYHQKDYPQALRLSQRAHRDYPETCEPLFYTAQIYLNQRNFEQAKEALQQLLQQHPMYAQGYYLQGILSLEQHDLEQAKQCLKKAVYIEQKFPMAYFSLGLAYSQNNEFSAAIRAYRNSLKILMQQENLEQEVELSGGFSHETLISICHNSIERLKVNYEACSVHT